IAFYQRHKVDDADYFLAAWKYRHRAQLGRASDDLSRFATEAGLSAKYLALVWSALTEGEEEVGPLAVVRKMWRELPGGRGSHRPGSVRAACERMLTARNQ
ncbi:hypothetical protein B4Q13_23115, partial [Lacticaseibacillus rhamnosus]